MTESSRPQRESCMTAGRIKACVESVSEPYAWRSTASTRSPASASNIAVAAPAQRTPTIITSKQDGNLMLCNMVRSSLSGAPRVFVEKCHDLLGNCGCIRSDTADEMRVTLAQKLEAQGVETGDSSDSIPMGDFAIRADCSRDSEPGEIPPVAGRPDDGANALCRERQAAWRVLRGIDGSNGIGPDNAVKTGNGIDAGEQPVKP